MTPRKRILPLGCIMVLYATPTVRVDWIAWRFRIHRRTIRRRAKRIGLPGRRAHG